MQRIIKKIFSEPILIEQPPVLIDIGASGGTHFAWKFIKKYSICIAFDADDRDILVTEKESDDFKQLFIFNRVVTDSENGKVDFFLTESPYCSSALQPDSDSLNVWLFKKLFNVVKKVSLPAISLKKAINEVGVEYVDWFKTDSQGTDLRLFLNIPDEVRHKIVVAEFEPGILDSYIYEDKLYSVLKAMELESFWLSNLDIKGTPRLNHNVISEKFSEQDVGRLLYSLKKSPCWGEMRFLKELDSLDSEREFLLAWLFSTLDKQYGYAYETSLIAKKKYKNNIFSLLNDYSLKQIKESLTLKSKMKRKLLEFCRTLFEH